MGFCILDLDFIQVMKLILVISEKVRGDEEKGFVPAV